MEDIASEIVYEFSDHYNETMSVNHISFWDDLPVKIIRILLYEAISLIGIIGSVITCIIVFFRQRVKSTPEYTFIGTAAIGDILYGLVSFVICPTYIHYNSWIFGEIFCFIAYFIDEFHQLYSIIILVTATCWTLCNANNLKIAVAINLIVALCSTILSLFLTVFTWTYATYNDHQYCHAQWSNDIFKKTHQLQQLLVNTALPILVILASCVIRNGNTSYVRLLMVIMTTIYVLLESPSTVMLIFFNHLPFGYWVVLGLLSQTKIVYKTGICYAMDRNFKEEFLDVVSRCFRKSRDHEGYQMQQNV